MQRRYAIIDQMLLMPGAVATIITGRANSMGAVIAAYGTRGKRFIMSHATAMLHPVAFGADDDYTEYQKRVTDFVQRDWEAKIASLARQMRQPKKRLMAMIDKALWLSPEEAIRVGLVDGIWTARMEAAVNTAARESQGSAGKLAQVGKILSVISDGIQRGEDFAVERDQET